MNHEISESQLPSILLENVRKLVQLESPPFKITPGIARAIKCAECILARPAFNEDKPSATASEVIACAGLSSDTVKKAFALLVQVDIADRGAPRYTFYSSPLSPRFTLNEAENSELAAGLQRHCERSIGTNILEYLAPGQREVVEELNRSALNEGTEVVITRVDMVNRTQRDSVTVGQIFDGLVMAELVEEVLSDSQERSYEYNLTERGVWYLGEMRSAVQEAESGLELHEQLIAILQRCYPKEQLPDIIGTIIEHVAKGVLTGGTADSAGEYEQLRFTPLAKANLDKKGILALTFYLDLAPAIGVDRDLVTAQKVRQFLALSNEVGLSSHIARVYHRPLLAKLKDHK